MCVLLPAPPILKYLHRMLVTVTQGQDMRDMLRYILFAKDQVAKKCTQKWPSWKFKPGTLISTPSVAVLNTIYKTGHTEVRGRSFSERQAWLV